MANNYQLNLLLRKLIKPILTSGQVLLSTEYSLGRYQNVHNNSTYAILAKNGDIYSQSSDENIIIRDFRNLIGGSELASSLDNYMSRNAIDHRVPRHA
jgi:hypothetical protein